MSPPAAVLDMNALVDVAQSRKTAGGVSEAAGMDQRLNQADKDPSKLQTGTTEAASEAQERAAQSDAKALLLKEENARLVTHLTQTQEALRKAERTIARLDSLVRRPEEAGGGGETCSISCRYPGADPHSDGERGGLRGET